MALDPATLNALAPVAGVAVISGPIAWVVTTWLKIKNGYPLESGWGKPLYPASSTEQVERIKLLSQENAQLKAEIGAVKDRLQVLERLATDPGHRLAAEIDSLGAKSLN